MDLFGHDLIACWSTNCTNNLCTLFILFILFYFSAHGASTTIFITCLTAGKPHPGHGRGKRGKGQGKKGKGKDLRV